MTNRTLQNRIASVGNTLSFRGRTKEQNSQLKELHSVLERTFAKTPDQLAAERDEDSRLFERMQEAVQAGDDKRIAVLEGEISYAQYQRNEPRKKIDAATSMKRLKKLSPVTVAILLDSLGSADLENRSDYLRALKLSSDLEVREYVSYMHLFHTRYLHVPPNRIFTEVRETMGISDLTAVEVDSTEHELISALIDVASSISSSRYYFLSEEDSASKARIASAMKDPFITEELAEIAITHAGKTSRLRSYFENESLIKGGSFDIDHLREYMSSSATSLSTGVL